MSVGLIIELGLAIPTVRVPSCRELVADTVWRRADTLWRRADTLWRRADTLWHCADALWRRDDTLWPLKHAIDLASSKAGRNSRTTSVGVALQQSAVLDLGRATVGVVEIDSNCLSCRRQIVLCVPLI